MRFDHFEQFLKNKCLPYGCALWDLEFFSKTFFTCIKCILGHFENLFFGVSVRSWMCVDCCITRSLCVFNVIWRHFRGHASYPLSIFGLVLDSLFVLMCHKTPILSINANMDTIIIHQTCINIHS